MKIKDVLYLPSGRIFLVDCNGYTIECTEMRDVNIQGKIHNEVRRSMDPRVVWKHLVPYQKKWLLTVSTEKSCIYKCQFCSCPSLPYKGGLTLNEITGQIDLLLQNTPHLKQCDKVKIGFARMGEPGRNLDNVLAAIKLLPTISANHLRDFRWLPCFNSIVPADCTDLIDRVVEVKERNYNGFLHFQISCNSTDEDTRRNLFGGAKVIPIEEIVKKVNTLNITNRTVTLNFIVMKGVEVDPLKLKRMGLTNDKFVVKLIPLNTTPRAEEYGLETYANYDNYEDLEELKRQFEQNNIPVVIDAIAKCEEAGLCCGQLAQNYNK
jgi:adenine C2-methylase RlmN of 23S rRNA A2503 and tRNA A37